MNSTRRYGVPISPSGTRLAAVIALLILAAAGRATAAAGSTAATDTYTAVYQGTRFGFTHIVWQHGARAIGIGDPTFGLFLRALGATMTWRAGQRDVLIATAQPEVIAFTVDDARYAVGRVEAQARFAPFLRGEEPYLPLNELLAALSLAQVDEQRGRVHLLVPQITALDVERSGDTATITAFAVASLQPRVVSRTPEQVTYVFDGVGSTLTGASTIGGGIQSVRVRTEGRPPAERTFVDVTLAQTLQSPTAPPPSGTEVTDVGVIPTLDDFTVAVDVRGDATYEWHRLRAPDDRFWIDVIGARLDTPARQDVWVGAHVTGVRVMQFTSSSVRVALSLAATQSITVVPSSTGVRVIVSNAVVASPPMSGSGSIGTTTIARVEPPPATSVPTALVATPTPAGGENAEQQSALPPEWKFAPRQPYVPSNPHLIVIDPGHGGEDAGTVYRGVMEKTLTLDMATRLRDILVARGWQVRMTRTTDHDVDTTPESAQEATAMGYSDPAASDLQARDDIANALGARLFISIHVNACCGTVDSTPSGTTSYYSKPQDIALARDVERAITAALGTKDDGIVKSRFYVTLHAFMPAVLVETAFLTNPTDYANLTSPQWRQRLAEAIADGIETYARENPVPRSSANQ